MTRAMSIAIAFTMAITVVQATLIVSGVPSCAGDPSGLNGNWLYMGVVQNGAPYWRSSSNSNNYLYYDADCDGGAAPGRWIFDVEAPSLSASKDLDGDSDCSYYARKDSSDLTSPTLGTSTWRVICNGAFVDQAITIVQASTTEVPTTEAPTTQAPTTQAPTTEAGAATTTAYSLIKSNHYCLRGGRVIMWTQRRSGGGKEASRSQAVLECASAVLADTECSSTFYGQVGECICMTSGTSCEEASNRKELQGLSIYTAKATTPATQAPNNVVAVTVSLNNIDFDRMNDEANIQVKTKLVDSIKQGFLDTLSGYTTQDLTVGLANGLAGSDSISTILGSIVANVKITPKIGADSYALKNVVTEELFNIQTAVITNVKAISNVNIICPTGKTAADISGTASYPREVVTGTGSASASMAVVMSANTLVIVCVLAF